MNLRSINLYKEGKYAGTFDFSVIEQDSMAKLINEFKSVVPQLSDVDAAKKAPAGNVLVVYFYVNPANGSVLFQHVAHVKSVSLKPGTTVCDPDMSKCDSKDVWAWLAQGVSIRQAAQNYRGVQFAFIEMPSK